MFPSACGSPIFKESAWPGTVPAGGCGSARAACAPAPSPKRFPEALPQHRDGVDLHPHSPGERRDLDRRAGGRVGRKVAPIHLVHPRELAKVRQEDGGAHDPIHSRPGRLQDRLQVVQDPLHLNLDASLNHLSRRRIQRNLSRHEQQVPGRDSLRVGADGGGGGIGPDHALGGHSRSSFRPAQPTCRSTWCTPRMPFSLCTMRSRWPRSEMSSVRMIWPFWPSKVLALTSLMFDSSSAIAEVTRASTPCRSSEKILSRTWNLASLSPAQVTSMRRSGS